MKKVFTIAWVLLVCGFSAHTYACDDDEVAVAKDHSEVIGHEDRGLSFTDLIMRQGKSFLCLPRTPSVDFDSLKNAKLRCEAKGGRLPELSELHNIASFISRNYFLEKKRTDRTVLDARFMHEVNHIWTATVRPVQDEYHHERAIASLAHLDKSTDMSKAKVKWVGTHLDNKEERPYICVFEKVPEL